MLAVYTDPQKKLLEHVATWNEKEDRNYDDVEASLIYLFFSGKAIFNPEEFPSFVKLTHQQLINLKNNLELFLSTADEIGFELECKKALEEINSEISSNVARSIQGKARWRNYLRFLGNGSVIFLISWIFCPPKIAAMLGCFGAFLYQFGEKLIRSWICYFKEQNALNLSKVIKKLNSNEIKAHLKWAEGHLEKIGWLEKSKPLTKEEKEKFKKQNPELAEAMEKFERAFSDKKNARRI